MINYVWLDFVYFYVVGVIYIYIYWL